MFLFSKVNKIHKTLARLTKKKKREGSNYYNQNERGDITTDLTEIIKIIEEYIHTYNMNNCMPTN